jgi:hypothetical protein
MFFLFISDKIKFILQQQTLMKKWKKSGKNRLFFYVCWGSIYSCQKKKQLKECLPRI